MRERFLTFGLVLIIWLIFVGRVTWAGVVIGIILSVVVSHLFSDMLFRVSDVRYQPKTYLKKLLYGLGLLPVFAYEAMRSAVLVTRYALTRDPHFKPGIVKVKTRLHSVTAITVLANLITLTPGTLTLDFDSRERVYTIHWIDIQTDNPDQAREIIIGAFEKRLEDIFQ